MNIGCHRQVSPRARAALCERVTVLAPRWRPERGTPHHSKAFRKGAVYMNLRRTMYTFATFFFFCYNASKIKNSKSKFKTSHRHWDNKKNRMQCCNVCCCTVYIPFIAADITAGTLRGHKIYFTHQQNRCPFPQSTAGARSKGKFRESEPEVLLPCFFSRTALSQAGVGHHRIAVLFSTNA